MLPQRSTVCDTEGADVFVDVMLAAVVSVTPVAVCGLLMVPVRTAKGVASPGREYRTWYSMLPVPMVATLTPR